MKVLMATNSDQKLTSTVAARSRAIEILRSANREAERIIKQAEIKAESLINDSILKAEAKANEKNLQIALSAVGLWRKALLDSQEFLIKTSRILAEEILQVELRENSLQLQTRISSCKALLQGAEVSTLTLAEVDRKLVENLNSDTFEDFQLHYSSELNAGEFELRTRYCRIKSSPTIHLDRLINELVNLAPRKTCAKILSSLQAAKS